MQKRYLVKYSFQEKPKQVENYANSSGWGDMTSFPGGEGSKAKVSSVGVRGMNIFWNYTLLHIALINQVAQLTKPC